MYPNIIINLNGLGDKSPKYKEILDYRLKLKHEGKKEEQAPLKLILNSCYGLLNNQYSQLNSPHLAYSVCIYGQVALYTLAERLAGIGADIININTDGVAYCLKGTGDRIIMEEWEKDFGLNLEMDHFSKWWQKDVNNYIAITDDPLNPYHDPYILCLGGDVNKYHKNKYFANNDIRITHKALVDRVVYGKDPVDTIMENLDNPLLYQYILQAGSTFQGVVESKKPDELLNTKINRVFATKDGVEIVKKRQDGGLVKFANAPGDMYLYNGDLKDLQDFKKIVDIQWYYDLTRKNLKRWNC